MINKVLQFYNYDKALAYFEDQLMHIHQAPVKRSGFKAVAKPVLLLTVLKAIDNGTISANRFDYNLLESHYIALFRQYFIQARQESLTPMYYPWYFMSHDDFWHLSWQGHEPIRTESPSAAFIRRNTTPDFSVASPKISYMSNKGLICPCSSVRNKVLLMILPLGSFT